MYHVRTSTYIYIPENLNYETEHFSQRNESDKESVRLCFVTKMEANFENINK